MTLTAFAYGMRDHHGDDHPSLLDRAFATGALTAIATGGALLGLGIREGEPGRAFRLAGRSLLERIGVPSLSAPLTSVTLGYVHHLVIATAWGVLIGLLILPLRGATRVIAAIAAAVLYGMITLRFVPPVLRIGSVVTSTGFGVVAVTVALGAALVGGVWLAASAHRE